MLDAVAVADVLDDPDRARNGGGRVVLEPERQRQIEQDLRVGRASDLLVEVRVDSEDEVALHKVELADGAVVHEEPAAVPERVAVRLLDRAPDRRADVREDERRVDMAGNLAQVPVVPGGLDAVEHARCGSVVIPADPEPVAVGRLGTEPRVKALVDQRM
jgi:hypothetical protein